MTDIKKGLAGVTVDETAISKVNPETNSLLYRGYPVQELAATQPFEAVAYLLWNGELPDAEQLAALRSVEREHRALPDDVRAAIDLLPTSAHPMDEVRTAVSVIGARETAGISNVMDAVGTPEQNLERSIRLWAQLPAVVAYGQRRRRGQELIAPRDDLDYAANFLWMTFGEEICARAQVAEPVEAAGTGSVPDPSTSSGSSGAMEVAEPVEAGGTGSGPDPSTGSGPSGALEVAEPVEAAGTGSVPDPSTGSGSSGLGSGSSAGAPDPVVVDAFNRSMILYAEHSFNASTFTARVIASTLSDLYSAVVGAIGALKGPLHGGANEAVLHVFDEVGTADNVVPWLDAALADKRKIMGFGHRVYKRGDSRVPTMKAALDTLVAHYDRPGVAALYDALESEFVSRKGIYPNLDYPSGPAYALMGFDTLTFTPLFVAARVTGWTAHIREQQAANALIRPLSEYVGHDERHVEGYVPDATEREALDRPEEAAS
ncbi:MULTISPECIES: citrate/2-methylcitrate synthase [Microbacterium]|uniref:citrate/2-methylcitrate synthase n=1 Tax=Microbacterium TaxID=33882 RepID=UPI0027877DD5|nr:MULTISPECIES: citrate/2-methylcitrate synthase [Microbacterium]MDQ1085301.1 citrate synthase [Microbacterium sp. SORGH_AS_0344]MDQ1169392.1 citrate synthase [Microbacterium proteolyticum]